MSDTRNRGKVRVGIDWEDKGWVSFGQEVQEDGDYLNLLTHARYFASSYGFIELFPYFESNTRRTRIVPAPVGDYGLEKLVSLLNTNNQYIRVGQDGNENRTIAVLPSTTYTLWAWVSTDIPFTNDADHHFYMEVERVDSAGIPTGTESIEYNPVGNNTIEPFYFVFTTEADTAFIYFSLSKGEEPDAEVLSIESTIHGMFLLDFEGIILPRWNGGTEFIAEPITNEITSKVLGVTGNIGKSTWESLLFDEGTINITLNNADKRFSPEFQEGQYYGYLLPYVRIWVAVENSLGDWYLLWAGWTHQFSIDTGSTNTRHAQITGQQGKYRIEAQDPEALEVVTNKYSTELIRLLFSGGYEIPYQDEDDVTTPDIILKDRVDRGVVVPLFSTAFVGEGEKSFLTSLEDISELNGNWMFLDRQGLIVFKTYQDVKDESPDYLRYSLAREMPYTYAPTDLFKEIVVTYDEYLPASDVEMQGQDIIIPAGASDFQFNIFPQYNNKPLIGDVILDVSSFLPVDYTAVPAFGSASAAFTDLHDGIYTYYTGLGGNTTDLDHRLSLVSRDSGDVWYANEADKKFTVTGITNRALESLNYSNPLIINEDMAADFAEMQVNRRASIVSWFTSATIVNKSDEAVDFIVKQSVGDVVFSFEEQMGEIPKHMIIIGERFTYEPGYLQMTYTLAPTGAEVDVAAFTYEVNGQVVDFTNLSVVSLPPTWAWDFGDS